MLSPHHLHRRASAVLHACGGAPSRADWQSPERRTRAARYAYLADWFLGFARDELHFLRLARPRGIASLRWHYNAYRRKRLAAHKSLRVAADYLCQAEKYARGP